jgi:hypothetical protein
MRIARRVLENLISCILLAVRMKPGYKVRLESNGGCGGPRYYSMSVVRHDFQGGDFLDFPLIGSHKIREMSIYLHGMLEGVKLQERLDRLPEVKE